MTSKVTDSKYREAMADTVEIKRTHLLTIALEDYFQVGAFNRLIQRRQWYRFETRLERNLHHTLDLLDQYEIKATFFVLGWIGEKFPELVRKVTEHGHEIASRGYYHRSISSMKPEELREDLARTREVLQRAGQSRISGFRTADGWLGPNDLWALDVLAEEGYAYDSSMAPRIRQFAREPWRRFEHDHKVGDRVLRELPIPSLRVGRWTVPIGGGNYFRQFPAWMMRRAVRRWHQRYQIPFMMYFHVWELDPDQPKISSASWMTRMRHYRNLHRMQDRLEHYFQNYNFTRIADYLKLRPELSEEEIKKGSDPRVVTVPLTPEVAMPDESGKKSPLTVVIPCYNEESTLPYLANTLKSVQQYLSKRCDLNFLFVNDGSSDNTSEALERIFSQWPNTRIIEHEKNKGVAAALLTGIREATTDLVVSIDCDCTYDPHDILTLLPLMTEDVDMVTASPYHPDGEVLNVPRWRLFLSKGSSFLYRRVLRQKLSTYTSCFRLYRRSAMLPLKVREQGFLGVAEMLGRLDLSGGKIVEQPAVLEVRMLGQSKMKTVRTILGHLKLLARLTWRRFRNSMAKKKSTEPTNIISHREPVTSDKPESTDSSSSQESVV